MMYVLRCAPKQQWYQNKAAACYVEPAGVVTGTWRVTVQCRSLRQFGLVLVT